MATRRPRLLYVDNLRTLLIIMVILWHMAVTYGAGGFWPYVDAFTGDFTWQSLFYSTWEEFICVGMIVVLAVWYRDKFDRQRAVARAMSASTYAAYFVHAPVLVFLAPALRRVSLHLLLKWALVSPLAVVLCFVIAYGLRKVPLVRRAL